ncbi:MAG: ABC transporter ATP-binding protein [Candidatus Sumerlaeota bacterium]|nr:ABC transporter ATP-binding protein [Candidatus Sumerlaeota bacterium]
MSDVILEARGLTKRYGWRLAVDGLDFDVRRGEIHGFLGRNGAGKSTTIRMILGLVRPTDGRVSVLGRPVRAGAKRDPWPVGAIIESPAFYDYLSARTNLEMLASLSGGASRARIDEILDLVGLTDRQREKVSVYSHGMRQRLGLAQALLPRPELLILDEPLDGLDPKGIRDLRDVMLKVSRERGVTIFLSSHILSEIEMTCGRVLVIHQGRRVFEGPTEELLSDSTAVRLRTGNGADPAALLSTLSFIKRAEPQADAWHLDMDPARVPDLNRALAQAGFDVLELTPLKRRLEDVFISLTGEPDAAETSGADS